MKRVFILGLLLVFLLTACGSKDLSVSDVWARTGTLGGNSAAYMLIKNPTSEDEILLSASSDVAKAVELHMSTMTQEGMMMMQKQENIPVAKGSEVELKPGGLHVMLIDLQRDLIAGETLQLTLHFQNAGEITLQVPIQTP